MMIGHEWIVELLERQQLNQRVPQSLLLVGPPNVGKSTLARYVAHALNCEADSKPCFHCPSCLKITHQHHPDLFVVDDDSQPLKIETIREVQRAVALSPVEGRYRVIILANFEKATTSAANALLKTLEEPPAQVVIILTAVNQAALLPTIVSRCQLFTLRPLPSEQVLHHLQTRYQLPEAQAKLLTQLSAGRLGWAIRALQDEQMLERRTQSLQDLLDLFRANRTQRLKYAHELSQNPQTVKETLLFWIVMGRDMLLLRSGCADFVTNLDWVERISPLIEPLSLSQLSQLVRQLREALINLDYNVNPRLNLEVTLLKLPKLQF